MERIFVLLLVLWCSPVGAFVSKPSPLAVRRNTLCVRKESSRTLGRVQHARPVWPRTTSWSPWSVATTRMSLMLLAEEDAPIVPPEQQESIISVLSVASSALLLFVVVGAVYLTYSDWQSKRDMEKTEKFIASTGELPELATQNLKQNQNLAEGEVEEEAGGNRQFRRMAKKEKKKSKS